ncbi:MAG: hypothetical protein V4671_31200 [Armatimonadota bacterium]
MTVWRLQTLGKPSLTQTDAVDIVDTADTKEDEASPTVGTVGFRNRVSWILLVSLTTDPGVFRRQELARRLWNESETLTDDEAFRNKLRPVLSDLIHGNKQKGFVGIGEKSIDCERDGIWLKPGAVITDVQEAETLYHRAIASEEIPTRMKPLRLAARLLSGSFLSGFDLAQAATPWRDIQEMRLERLRYQVWKRLLETAEKCGDPVTVAEAWQQLQGIDAPPDIDTEIAEPASAARLSRIAKSRRAGRSGKTSAVTRLVSWDALLPYLEKQEQNGFPLSVGEEKALLQSLNRRLSFLPKPCAVTFRSFSVFPQPFTARQAAVIAGVTCPARIEESIGSLLKASLLRKAPRRETGSEAAAEEGVEERYNLPPFASALVWQTLSSSRKTCLRARHAQHFMGFICCDWTEDRASFRQWFLHEQANYLQALDVCLESPLTEETMAFLNGVHMGMGTFGSGEMPLLQRTILQRATPRLREAIESERHFGDSPAILLSFVAREEQDFAGAIHWANIAVQSVKTGDDRPRHLRGEYEPVGTLSTMLNYVLMAAHHGGCHDDFDRALQAAWDLIPKIVDDKVTGDKPRINFQCYVRAIAAENCWARGNLESALRFNEEGMTDLKRIASKLQDARPLFAASHYQRGCIQWDRGERDNALHAWNEALGHFGEMNALHGIADCKKRLGRALAEMGQPALGQDVVCEAIALYKTLENEASRTAALGTLADVLVLRGKPNEARRYYEEGLAYWRTIGHASWIGRFETALAHLPPLPSPESPEEGRTAP